MAEEIIWHIGDHVEDMSGKRSYIKEIVDGNIMTLRGRIYLPGELTRVSDESWSENQHLREQIEHLNKRIEVERQVADGYARSCSIEYRDKLEREIRELKSIGQAVVMDCLARLNPEQANEIVISANYKQFKEATRSYT